MSATPIGSQLFQIAAKARHAGKRVHIQFAGKDWEAVTDITCDGGVIILTSSSKFVYYHSVATLVAVKVEEAQSDLQRQYGN